MTRLTTRANLKKVATQGSKGGTIVITLEVQLNEENAALAAKVNNAAALTLSFAEDDLDKVAGQQRLPLEEGDDDWEDEDE
jgi:hypothetical protein